MLVNGGATIKSMSAAFMADVERAWRKHGPKVLDVLAEKYPQAFFAGMVAMTKVIRWETGADAASFSRTMTLEQVMDKLEERVGPEGRKLFEQFIRKVNILQAFAMLAAIRRASSRVSRATARRSVDPRERLPRTAKKLATITVAGGSVGNKRQRPIWRNMARCKLRRSRTRRRHG